MNSELPFVCIQRLDSDFLMNVLLKVVSKLLLVLPAQFSKRIEVRVQTFFTLFYSVFTEYLGPYQLSAMERLYKDS